MKRYEEIRERRDMKRQLVCCPNAKIFLTLSCNDMTLKTCQNSPRSVASWVPAGHAAAVTSNLSSTHMLETCSPWEMWPLGVFKKGAVERVDCEVGQKVWHPAKVRKYPFLRVSWMKRWAEGEVGGVACDGLQDLEGSRLHRTSYP